MDFSPQVAAGVVTAASNYVMPFFSVFLSLHLALRLA
jgi:hypothetical protein